MVMAGSVAFVVLMVLFLEAGGGRKTAGCLHFLSVSIFFNPVASSSHKIKLCKHSYGSQALL